MAQSRPAKSRSRDNLVKDKTNWHRITPNDKNKKEHQMGECSQCGTVRIWYSKKDKGFRCSRKNRKTQKVGLLPENWHTLSEINRDKKETQPGLCSKCGPVTALYDSYGNQFSCSNKKNTNLANKKNLNPDFNKKIQQNKQRYRWKVVYKLEVIDIENILIEQNYQCSICFTKLSMETSDKNIICIDHDHKCCPRNGSTHQPLCGKCNRGLLCSKCNLALGGFNDDITLLKNAINYLERYP